MIPFVTPIWFPQSIQIRQLFKIKDHPAFALLSTFEESCLLK